MELLISGPEGSSTNIELRKPILSLGRSADNDLPYPEDPWLSRYHLTFEKHKDGWFVKDCASRNGTVVNATSLKEPHKMSSGDRIYVGHLTIEVRETLRGSEAGDLIRSARRRADHARSDDCYQS